MCLQPVSLSLKHHHIYVHTAIIIPMIDNNEATWLESEVIVIDEEQAAIAESILRLFAIGDEGVAIEQKGDPNDVAPMAMLPAQHVRLYIDGNRDTATLRRTIIQTLHENNLPSPSFTVVSQKDWSTAWREHYRPLKIGNRIWVRPTWETITTPDNHIVIELEPGMAFGTGTHETTQLCLTALESYLQPNDTIIDLGCGSGVLAIGAIMLGAKSALGVDIAAEAIIESKHHAQMNKVNQAITWQQGSLDIIPPNQQDIVVANILCPILIEMLDNQQLLTYVKDGGFLILSGILAVQAEEIGRAINDEKGTIIETMVQGDWIAIVIQKK